jgi:hypothetical protein
MNTYYLTSKFKVLYAIIPIVILSLLFPIFKSNYICFGIYSILILLASFKNIISEHLVVSNYGIEYHRLGLTFSAKWENIKEINEHWSLPYKQEGIHIDPDLIQIKEWWSGSFKVFGGLGRKTFIPLSRFSENWRDSELGQHIKRYAPYLFQ